MKFYQFFWNSFRRVKPTLYSSNKGLNMIFVPVIWTRFDFRPVKKKFEKTSLQNIFV